MSTKQREEQATRILTDPLYKEAFEVLKEDLMNRWEHSRSTELEARESIWLAMRLLERIQGHLKSIIETGHMAEIMEKHHPHI